MSIPQYWRRLGEEYLQRNKGERVKDKSKVLEAIGNLKEALNEYGSTPKLTTTGALRNTWGPKSEESLKNALAKDSLPLPTKGDYFGAPWVGANIDLLGRDETDAELNARYTPEWKLEGLNYKTLAGNTHAWCSLKVNADLRKVGVKGTNSAGASSWSKWGRSCPFWFGAVLPIKHKSGGRHVGFFIGWVDESKKLAAVYGGNQSNKLSIVSTNISGSGDTLVPGPRWPEKWPDGQALTLREIAAKYPLLRVGGTAGSTR